MAPSWISSIRDQIGKLLQIITLNEFLPEAQFSTKARVEPLIFEIIIPLGTIAGMHAVQHPLGSAHDKWVRTIERDNGSAIR